MEKKRDVSFDILRIISMFMVVIIHVSNVYSRSFGIISNKSFFVSLVFNTISRISVPIFFMISGALLVNREFDKKKYIKRLNKYIILIIVWDLIYLIWEYLYLGTTYDKLYMLLVQPYRAHLWFLYTIIVLYFVQPLIKMLLDSSNKTVKILLLLLWLIFSSLSMINSFIANYFTIFSYIGFFVVGKYLKDFIDTHDLRKYKYLLIILMSICYSISIVLNYITSIRINRFYNLFFAYRTPFIMIASMSFFVIICSLFKKCKGNKIISLLSDVSLGVYLVHGIFLDITIKMFIYGSINSLIGIPLFSFVISISSILVIYILKKINIFNFII